ncbi:hypothetical protein FACS189421_13050 [Bacteroidia bacterium]|nr:hypothetical protein FACS189421_13050 [Bacteroidia bacterium]GHT02471.1 hypothetical protein FACS189423_01240 [Bacteroidia bacterium]GHT49702.1 hypothetical protein FACS189440_15870 [Bacteroidia bacterium]
MRKNYQETKIKNMAKINVKGTDIVLINREKEDYISLTDIAKVRDSRILNTSNSMCLEIKQG